MKYFQFILILFMFFVNGNKVFANFISEYNGFYSVTLGAHATSEVDPYVGVMGYFGCLFNFDESTYTKTGIGVLVSREKGSTRVKGYKFESNINTLSLSLSVKFENSLLIVSRGISAGTLSLNNETRSGSGEIYSLHYVYRIPTNWYSIKSHVMAGFRTQGQGVMVYVGIGSGF